MKKMLGMALLCGICLFGCQNETDKIVDEYENLGYTITYEVEENLIEKSNRMSVKLSIYVQIHEGTYDSYEREKQILKDLMTDLSEHFYEEYGEYYCKIDLDEDEMERYAAGRYSAGYRL